MEPKAKLAEVTATGLQELIEFIKAGTEVVGEQAPLVAQEIVMYGRASNTLYVIGSLIVLFAWYKALVWAWNDETSSNWEAPVTIFGVVIIVFALLGFCASISSAIMAWFAPRLYVLDTIKDFIN